MNADKAASIAMQAVNLVAELLKNKGGASGSLATEIDAIWRFAKEAYELEHEQQLPRALEDRHRGAVIS
ncbi:hypothetical protein A2994_03865 [candidate division Kazan bacterium RIFCSPLOWO2_01_FULL_48_13]|uniref:Uncharacterized protein n=1 Tax=candidate division Kazan bacterium RIFCSPLOWO2_01_FULL_48_13 TaxID=1798539 RepID=A0A1F4PNB8_UNCK3|nr:MAG: hypothetical protein A2994_03865 [candidate division Kazan bacterium RIFCSPLOWO2_01_FULL_48_13]